MRSRCALVYYHSGCFLLVLIAHSPAGRTGRRACTAQQRPAHAAPPQPPTRLPAVDPPACCCHPPHCARQVAAIREQLAALYEAQEEWSKAAHALAGIDLDSGMRLLDAGTPLGCAVVGRVSSFCCWAAWWGGMRTAWRAAEQQLGPGGQSVRLAGPSLPRFSPHAHSLLLLLLICRVQAGQVCEGGHAVPGGRRRGGRGDVHQKGQQPGDLLQGACAARHAGSVVGAESCGKPGRSKASTPSLPPEHPCTLPGGPHPHPHLSHRLPPSRTRRWSCSTKRATRASWTPSAASWRPPRATTSSARWAAARSGTTRCMRREGRAGPVGVVWTGCSGAMVAWAGQEGGWEGGWVGGCAAALRTPLAKCVRRTWSHPSPGPCSPPSLLNAPCSPPHQWPPPGVGGRP